MEEPGRLQSMGSQRVGHNWTTSLSLFTYAVSLIKSPSTVQVLSSWKSALCWVLLLLSCQAVSNSLQPHGLQHTRPPCPSPTARIYSNSCPLSHWCHPTISSSVAPFSCLQSFPASWSFPVSGLFASGSQRIGALASSISPSNKYSGLISFKKSHLSDSS